jgi:hypothetical protein
MKIFVDGNRLSVGPIMFSERRTLKCQAWQNNLDSFDRRLSQILTDGFGPERFPDIIAEKLPMTFRV